MSNYSFKKSKNIRATTLKKFWGTKFNESIYLWHEAKHNLTLKEIINNEIPTSIDLFSSKEEINSGHEFCQNYYYKVLPELVKRLNKFHQVDFSINFWKITFGYWLYRHISVAYSKFSTLKNIELDHVDIKLLDINDFYVPTDHFDYLSCFSSDFGVQQIISQYFYLYQTKKKSIINYTFKNEIKNDSEPSNLSFREILKGGISQIKSLLKFILFPLFRKKPVIVLLGVYYAKSIANTILKHSNKQILSINLPKVKLVQRNADLEIRTSLFSTKLERSFDSFLFHTLIYCMPKFFIENFKDFYMPFNKDIIKKSFSYIVSEDWISNIPNAIYIGLAKEMEKIFINNEHAASSIINTNNMNFIGFDVGDITLTNHLTSVKGQFTGGFSCRDITNYTFKEDLKKVLFISRIKFLYMTEIVQYNAVNSTFIRELKRIDDFINQFPVNLKNNLYFRPRRTTDDFFWDVEKVLEITKYKINIDSEDFVSSILNSRIVVINHISTGLGEIVHMDVPFLLLYDVGFLPLTPEIKVIFDDLINCGVVHSTVDSAINHLTLIYDDVGKWWYSENVKVAVKNLKQTCYAPSKTSEFLFSLLKKN